MTLNEYIQSTKAYFSELFSLQENKANEKETVVMIKKGVEFKGLNVWILIFATFIGSIGLNLNSTAVIIGAMLISPLMGPIMGVGLSLGIYDFELFTRSMKNLSVMVVVSIVTSALYFSISPLEEAQSELLARTTPTIWDVFIGVFGGLAGIVAGSSPEKGNAIPGVAIATALMPPLCTAGYGMAHWDATFFLGGFYLFVINTMFIALTTYFIVRVLNFQKKEILDKVREQRVNMIIPILAVLTIIPSIFMAVNLVQDTVRDLNINRFMNEELNSNETQVLSSEIIKGKTEELPDTLSVFIIGRPYESFEVSRLNQKLTRFISNTVLKLNQELIPHQRTDIRDIASDIVKDLYAVKQEEIRTQSLTIDSLRGALSDVWQNRVDIESVTREVQSFEPNLRKMAIQRLTFYDADSMRNDTTYLAVVEGREPILPDRIELIRSFLKARIPCEHIEVISR